MARRTFSHLSLFVVSHLCLLAARAEATPEYPSVVDGVMQTDCGSLESRCLMCHTSSSGGKTTATQPFAMSLRSYGLVRGRDPAGLTRALTFLPETTDSDLDGRTDKQELEECLNPSGEDSIIEPVYGCGGVTLSSRPWRRRGSSDAWPCLAVLAAAFWRVRDRARRRCDRARRSRWRWP